MSLHLLLLLASSLSCLFFFSSGLCNIVVLFSEYGKWACDSIIKSKNTYSYSWDSAWISYLDMVKFELPRRHDEQDVNQKMTS